MKKNAYEETTIKATAKRLNHLQRNSLLADPESIKTFVATKKCSNGFKESLVEAYDILIRSQNLTWNKPFYARYDKLPKIPTEEKINMLISKANTRMALFLSISKDLGSRPIELTWLKVARACQKERTNLPKPSTEIFHLYMVTKRLRNRIMYMKKRPRNDRRGSQETQRHV